MRFVYLGDFTVQWSTHAHVGRALRRIGHEVTMIDPSYFRDLEAIERIGSIRPDVFLFSTWNSMSRGVINAGFLAIIAAIRPQVGKIVNWHFDCVSPEYSTDRFRRAEMISKRVDLFVISDAWAARSLAAENVVVIRQGAPDDVEDVPNIPVPQRIIFLGGLSHGDRLPMHRAFVARFGDLYRNVNHIKGEALNSFVRPDMIFLGPIQPSFPGYWSNRLYVVAAHGGCFVTPTVEGMSEEGWEPGVNYVSYTTLDDQLDVVQELLDDPRRVEEIGRNASRHVWANCTYDHRARELVSHLKRIGASG